MLTPPIAPLADALAGLLVDREDLYVPRDIEEQRIAWGADCAPIALAALLGKEVAAIRDVVERVTGSPYPGAMTTNSVVDVLRAYGRDFLVRHSRARGDLVWPRGRGLSMLTVETFTNGDTARLRGSYVVATADCGLLVFDGNVGKWLPSAAWAWGPMHELAITTLGGNSWHIAATIEVE